MSWGRPVRESCSPVNIENRLYCGNGEELENPVPYPLQDVMLELKKRLGDKLLSIHIRESVKIAECPSFCEPIITYDKKGAGAEDFRALAKIIMKRGCNE